MNAKPVERPTPTIDDLAKPKPAEAAATPAPPEEKESVPAAEMPRYKCHKEVHALKIQKVRTAEGKLATLELVPEDARFAPIEVSASWAEQHAVVAGGYYVLYKGGYASFSPADVFEDGYTLVEAKAK